jgi:hypothetical protein
MMTNLKVAILAAAALLVVGTSLSSGAQTVPATFFGMQMGKGILAGEPWPVDSFGTTRLWDSGTSWPLINFAPGQYDWSALDAWINKAQRRNIDVVYCFGRVPQWASSNPNDLACANGGGPGQCDPPNDLNDDGSGSDRHFKDFVTAVATRSAGRIHYWELWDEAANPLRWRGTIAQIMRMDNDASAIIRSIDPSAVILSPSGGILATNELQWWGKFLAAGGGDVADVIAYHGYIQRSGSHPVPENLISVLNSFRTNYLKPNGQAGKPDFDSEGSWGIATCCDFTDPDLQAGFVARFVLMHWLEQTDRFYWYQWDSTAGTLWTPSTNFTGKGVLLKPGLAYRAIYNWMVGFNVDRSCTVNKTVWACNLSGSGGYLGQIVWDTSKTCNHGVCTESQYKFDPTYTRYVSLYGKVKPLQGSTVPIGYLPILLQNHNP